MFCCGVITDPMHILHSVGNGANAFVGSFYVIYLRTFACIQTIYHRLVR
jgi:hypothetical protein